MGVPGHQGSVVSFLCLKHHCLPWQWRAMQQNALLCQVSADSVTICSIPLALLSATCNSLFLPAKGCGCYHWLSLLSSPSKPRAPHWRSVSVGYLCFSPFLFPIYSWLLTLRWATRNKCMGLSGICLLSRAFFIELLLVNLLKFQRERKGCVLMLPFL